MVAGAYPPEYKPRLDLQQAIESGDLPSATELVAELANVAESINQSIGFIKALATVDRKFRPNTFVGTFESEEVQFEATAAQTNFDFSVQITVDPLTASVHVYTAVAGSEQIHLIDPTLVTLNAGSVDIPARADGDIVLVQLFDGADSLLSQLASSVAGLGASLIVIEDVEGLYGADDVEGALAEARGALNSFVNAVGDLNTYLKADGSVAWTGNQNAGNQRLTNLRAAQDDMDAVNLKQVNAILGDISDLTNKFLKITGGSMRGNINMLNTYRMSNLAKPVADNDAVRKIDLDAVTEGKLATGGTAVSAAVGTMTGPATYGADYSDYPTTKPVADQNQATDPADVVVPTWYGIPYASAPSQVVPKGQMDEENAVQDARLANIEQELGSAIVDPAGCSIDSGGAADLSVGGEFNFDSTATQTSPVAVGGDLIVFADGNLNINGIITMNTAGAKLHLRCSGVLTINAEPTGTDLEVALEGDTIVLGAGVNAGTGGTVQLKDVNGFTPNIGTITAGTITRAGGPILAGSTGMNFDADAGGGVGGSAGSAESGTLGTGGEDSRYIGTEGEPGKVDVVDVGGGGGASTSADGGNGGQAAGPLGGGGDKSAFIAATANHIYLFTDASGSGGGSQGVAAAGNGGGIIDFYCAGAAVLTGCVFSASGAAGGGAGGGGAGGFARIVATDEITDGTLAAEGGAGGGAVGGGDGGGGGAGGRGYLVAPSFAGAPTLSVSGGAGGPSGTSGGAGVSGQETLTTEQIECLHSQGVW